MRDVIHCLRGTDFCPSHPFRGTIWGQNYEKNMKTGRKYGEKEKMQRLIDNLEDLDDVMNVYHNWEQ